MTTQTTTKLFETVNADLLAGRWTTARKGLDELARRKDLRHSLSEPWSYPLPETEFGFCLADRIDLVNDRVALRS